MGRAFGVCIVSMVVNGLWKQTLHTVLFVVPLATEPTATRNKKRLWNISGRKSTWRISHTRNKNASVPFFLPRVATSYYSSIFFYSSARGVEWKRVWSTYWQKCLFWKKFYSIMSIYEGRTSHVCVRMKSFSRSDWSNPKYQRLRLCTAVGKRWHTSIVDAHWRYIV